MKRLLIVVVFFTCLLSLRAQAVVFYLEPYGGGHFNSVFDEGSGTNGKISGWGGGIRLFGFFTKSLYLGIYGHQDAWDLTFIKPAGITKASGSNFGYGPLLGAFAKRFRVWVGFAFSQSLKQKYFLSSQDVKVTKTGTGLTLGVGFWVWPNFGINLEYFAHTFKKFDQTLPSSSKGDLSDPLKTGIFMITGSFPLKISK